jgi:hypothetical protein
MTAPVQIVGQSAKIAYADDSTEVSIAFDQPAPTALMIYNADTANVVVVNAGFVDGDVDAIVPTSDQNGVGLVVGPAETQILMLSSTRGSESGNLYVSVAGDSATGNVYITPVTLEPTFTGY